LRQILSELNFLLAALIIAFSGANVANFNKIHRTVSEQQLFKKWNSKTEVSSMEVSLAVHTQ